RYQWLELAPRSQIERLAPPCSTNRWTARCPQISNARDIRRRAVRLCNGRCDAAAGAGNRHSRWRASNGGTCRYRRIAPALSLDVGASSNPTATLAQIILSGAAGSVVAATCSLAAAVVKTVAVAAMRRRKPPQRRSV